MTNDYWSIGDCFVPFVFRYAQRMEEHPLRMLRYDSPRQIAQVLIDGSWLDTPDAPGDIAASTRMTKVARETTDDQ